MRISNLERKEEEEVPLQNKDIYGLCDTARALFALIVCQYWLSHNLHTNKLFEPINKLSLQSTIEHYVNAIINQCEKSNEAGYHISLIHIWTCPFV